MKRIYQLFSGRLPDANIRDHQGEVLRRMANWDWERLAEAGFDSVYLLGIFDHQGPLVVGEEEGEDLTRRQDRVPSVFAIRNHQEVDPGLGSRNDFVTLVNSIHQAKLRVLVDLVPNHTGLHHPWLKTHPDYYQDGGKVREFSGDVAKLNYQNEKLRNAMIEVMLANASLGVDGFRVDMAHLVPEDFWQTALIRIRESYPGFIFIAEAYSVSVFDWSPLISLAEAGFDWIYHEFWYRNVKEFFRRNRALEGVAAHFEYVLAKKPVALLAYVANHDDALVCFYNRFTPAVTAITELLPGPMLYFNGSVNGLEKRLAHHHVDLLEEKLMELKQVPDWFTQLVKFVDEYKPEVRKVIPIEDLMTLSLETGGSDWWLVANWGEMSVEWEVIQDHIGEAVTMWFGKKQALNPGDFVIAEQSIQKDLDGVDDQ